MTELQSRESQGMDAFMSDLNGSTRDATRSIISRWPRRNMRALGQWLDAAIDVVSPRAALKRRKARLAGDQLVRHYEAASVGRRTQGWRRTGSDANAAIGPSLALLRQTARDLERNNPYAEAALATYGDHAVGVGIVAKPNPMNKPALKAWRRWAESTDCDADGRHDFAGLTKLVIRTVARDGEVLVRRRIRRPGATDQGGDGFFVPMQLQVIEADYLDASKDSITYGLDGRTVAGQIIQGVEFDPIGRRVAYWLYPRHPGDPHGGIPASVRVPAESVLHIFDARRPGQVRGPSWFAPVIMKMKDFDEFEDATLMKQKIAACLAVLYTDIDGTSPGLGQVDATKTPEIDLLEPGMIKGLSAGQSIQVVEPPQARDYKDFSVATLRAIATGLGIPYEDLTGDFSEVNFSSSRMARLRHWDRVDDWRWKMLVPQFCNPAWAWYVEAATVMGIPTVTDAEWTAPAMPMIDPANEGLAIMRNVRAGIQTMPEAIRERGYDPIEFIDEMADFYKELDKRGIILDSDPRKMTQAGQAQAPLTDAARPTDAMAAAAARHTLELVPRR